MPRKPKNPRLDAAAPALDDTNTGTNTGVSDEVSRSSLNESHVSAPDGTTPGSPLTETGSSTHEPTDFSALKEDDTLDLDEDFEVHPQHSILASTDTTRQFIKRPLNAYMMWTRHARDGILKDNPHLKMNEVSKTMGEMWKKLPDDDKKPFFLMARKAAAKHKKALEMNPKLAYVPSKKKVKKVEKKEDEHKDEAKRASPSPYPTPSASPVTSATRPNHGAVSETPRGSIQYSTPNTAPRGAPYPGQTYPQPGYYQATPYPQPQVRYVHQSYTYGPAGNGGYAAPPAAYYQQQAQQQQQQQQQQQAQGHLIPNPRDPTQTLVRNPFAPSYTDPPEPVYEPESAELYRELYYRSLVSHRLHGEPDTLPPDFYLQRFYALGGQDQPIKRSAALKAAQSNSNGLVYQEL